MPKNPNRLRHGPGHPRIPAPLTREESRRRTPVHTKKRQAGAAGAAGAEARFSFSIPGSGRSGSIPGLPPLLPGKVFDAVFPIIPAYGFIPAKIVDAFYQNLPDPGLQQITVANSIDFSPSDLDSGITIGSLDVPSEQVYVITDVYFFATFPGGGMAAPPVTLTAYQLTGLMRFDLQIGGRSPMNLSVNAASPYNDPANYPLQGNLSGWQMLDTRFGSSRSGSFALYARAGQDITVHLEGVQNGRWPRFPITQVGYHLHAYNIPEGDFETLWRSFAESEFDYGRGA